MRVSSSRVFFDTSVYIAGLLSFEGAAGELIRAVEAGGIRMVVSPEVVIEIDRVLERKFPDLVCESRMLLKHLAPEMTPTPAKSEVDCFKDLLEAGDALILSAARLVRPDVFVTWNTRHFMKPKVMALVDFPILVPGDCLRFLGL